MRRRKTVRRVAGIGLILLGGLWILQGADVVRMRPVLCVANCKPIVGGSPTWFAIGVITVLIGIAVTGTLRRRRWGRI